MSWKGVIEEYREFLPLPKQAPVVTLLEGNTPLIPALNFVRSIGGEFELFLKYEAVNPTCSFKDRGMTMAMSVAKNKNAQWVICASTGNTSASAAAYAARARMKCAVILPAGKIALGKLAQAIVYGAQVVPIKGNFDDALNLVRELGKRPEVEIVNSINPFRIEGQKTASFEICDTLKKSPDYHFLPVGNAGNITAYWKGFQEYFAAKKIKSLPKMMGWQAEGSAPIVENRVIENPQTLATAIRIGNPASWEGATTALKESKGNIDKVTDEEILDAYRLLAQTEGIFAEPASVAPLAGLKKIVKSIPSGALITATLTGHGLKDPEIAMKSVKVNLNEVEPTTHAVLKALAF
ncbi:MAG: threonine synthase [Verrucomicrobiota bacterium]